jgi:nucleotide-binding universal stress UspA family protein
MRVLLAMDGSPASDVARDLVASLTWPSGTVIRLVAVVEPMSSVLIGLAPYAAAEFDDREIAAALDQRLTDASTQLVDPGRVVEKRVLRGRPASTIVDEATEMRADIIVLGSRGLGRLRSMLLGSVSAEVVDHAPCPVLVARAPSVEAVLVAVDGSTTAIRAVENLADAQYLAGHRLEVLSVGPLFHAFRPYWAVDLVEPAARTPQVDMTEDRQQAELHAARAAETLGGSGFQVRWTIATGDPSHEIIEAAHNLGCNLIVMGSRGLTGLDRLLLGSVARNVLLHAPTSVLIVREPVRQRRTESTIEQVRLPSLAPTG